MAKNDFQYGRWNSYTLQCGTITTLISSGDCTLQCGMSFKMADLSHLGLQGSNNRFFEKPSSAYITFDGRQ